MRISAIGAILKSTSPYCTARAVLDAHLRDVPATSADTAFISFITSMMQSCAPSSTRLPTSTNGGASGVGRAVDRPDHGTVTSTNPS